MCIIADVSVEFSTSSPVSESEGETVELCLVLNTGTLESLESSLMVTVDLTDSELTGSARLYSGTLGVFSQLIIHKRGIGGRRGSCLYLNVVMVIMTGNIVCVLLLKCISKKDVGGNQI